MKKRLTKTVLLVGATAMLAIGAYSVKTAYAGDCKQSCKTDVEGHCSEKGSKDK